MELNDSSGVSAPRGCVAGTLTLSGKSHSKDLLAELCADERLAIVTIDIARRRPTDAGRRAIHARCDPVAKRCEAVGLDPELTERTIASIISAEVDIAWTMLRLLIHLLDGSTPLVIRRQRADQKKETLPAEFVTAIGALFDIDIMEFDSADAVLATSFARQAPHRLLRPEDRELFEVLTSADEELGPRWSRWLERATVDDQEGFPTVAPILQERLKRIGFHNGESGRLAGLRRRAWYANSLLKVDVVGAVHALRAEGIDPVLTGDLVHALDAEEHDGVRVIRVPSLLVTAGEAQPAAAAVAPILQPRGPVSRFNARSVMLESRMRLTTSTGNQLGLDWRWLPDRSADRVPITEELLRTVRFDGIEMQALGPSACLVSLIANAGDLRRGHALTTLMQLTELIDRHHHELDWNWQRWAVDRLELADHAEALITSLPERTRSLIPAVR